MFDEQDLIKIANYYKMPFGRYKDTILIHLPEKYLFRFVDKGCPAGKLGQSMQITLEIKINSLEGLIHPLQKPRTKELQMDP